MVLKLVKGMCYFPKFTRSFYLSTDNVFRQNLRNCLKFEKIPKIKKITPTLKGVF